MTKEKNTELENEAFFQLLAKKQLQQNQSQQKSHYQRVLFIDHDPSNKGQKAQQTYNSQEPYPQTQNYDWQQSYNHQHNNQSQNNAATQVLKTPPTTQQDWQKTQKVEHTNSQYNQQKTNNRPQIITTPQIQNNTHKIPVEIINDQFQQNNRLFSNSFGKGKSRSALTGTDKLVRLIEDAITFSTKGPEPTYTTNLFTDSTKAGKELSYKLLSEARYLSLLPIACVEYKIKGGTITDVKCEIKNNASTNKKKSLPEEKLKKLLPDILGSIKIHTEKVAIHELPTSLHETIEEICKLFSLSELNNPTIDDINNYIESFYLLNYLAEILKTKQDQTATIDPLIKEKKDFINYLSKYYKIDGLYGQENRNNYPKFPHCFQPKCLDDKPFAMIGESKVSSFTFPDNSKVKFFTKLQRDYIEDIKQQIRGNSNDITVISGPPGSGKTDLIKFLTESNIEDVKILLEIESGSNIKFGHLNYGSFYTYDNFGKKQEKSEADIKKIIDELMANKLLISNQSGNQKTFLFVDEWGVMYPKYVIDYLKAKQSESAGKAKQSESAGNLAIIGVTAHQEPAKALLDHESGRGIKIKYIDPQILAGNENNNQNQNDEFIVDFTREINNYKKFKSFLRDSSIPLPTTKPYIIINQYKDPRDNSNKYMLAHVTENDVELIARNNIIDNQSGSYYAFNKEELQEEVEKIKKEKGNQNIKTIYHYSFSVARGGDMGMVSHHENKNYKVILNDSSSVNFVDNLEQALTRDRSFNVEDLSDKNKKINIQCFKRNPNNTLEQYSQEEITNKIKQRNNFFNLKGHNQNSDNKATNSDLSTNISDEDRNFLIEEINNQSDEDKEITKIIVSYLDLIEKLPNTINKAESIKSLTENNRKLTANFMICYNRAITIRRLIDLNSYERGEINFPIRNTIIKDGQSIDIPQSRISIKIEKNINGRIIYKLSQDLINSISQYPIQKLIELSPLNNKEKSPHTVEEYSPNQNIDFSNNQNLSQITEKNLLQEEKSLSEISNNGGKKFSQLLQNKKTNDENPQESGEQNSWNYGRIFVAITGTLGVIGGIGYATYRYTSGSSTSAGAVAPPTNPIPQINPFIQANGNALSSDLRSHLKPINYIENHYNVKNIAINHHQHSTSLIGKSNLSIGHLGATKTAHLSLASSTASKVGLATKAGLLAGAFTPFLAIAGIGAVGYLGYKAYEYWAREYLHETSDKVNEEIANKNPDNNIKTASHKTLKEISLQR